MLFRVSITALLAFFKVTVSRLVFGQVPLTWLAVIFTRMDAENTDRRRLFPSESETIMKGASPGLIGTLMVKAPFDAAVVQPS